MKTIMTKAVLSHLSTGEAPRYRLVSTSAKHINEMAFVQRMMEVTGETDVQCRYWLDAFRRALFGALGENEAVDIGFLFAKLYVGGTIGSLSDQPTMAANPVIARVFLKGEFSELVRSIPVENTTVTVEAVMYEVMQDGASDRNRIESATARVVINGSAIKIDPEQTDNGVWLEDPETGLKVADGTVIHSDSSTCHVTFPTLPETGKYKLVIATRDGNDPTEYTLAKAVRNVKVIHEANA